MTMPPFLHIVVLLLAIFSISASCPLSGTQPQQSSESTLCCFYSPSPGDICGSCESQAKADNWCAASSSNCKHCGGTWCTTTSSAPKAPISDGTAPTTEKRSSASTQKNATPGPTAVPIADAKAPIPENSSLTTKKDSPAAENSGSSAQGNGFDDHAPPTIAASGNPFVGKKLYVNPTFKHNIQNTIKTATTGVERENLIAMSTVASAYWLDSKSKVQPGDDSSTDTAAGILKDAASMKTPPLVTMIVYDLPNRDCAAKASNGEICCVPKKNGVCNYAASTCTHGLEEYKHEYIDKLAISVKKYCDIVPMVLVIEPDSLPNLVTNLGEKSCGSKATSTAYREGITYAVKALSSACSRATLYVDAAHGGWLGWDDNRSKFVAEIKSMGISKYIRGFSLNVANYQPLGTLCPEVGFCVPDKNKDHPCCNDPCGLSKEYNPGHSELNYAAALIQSFSKDIQGFSPKVIIDTGRNAKSSRASCSNWCNARGAGCGHRPTTKTAAPDLVDAYHWLKTPGESDGCTEILPSGGKCPRFDASCASADSIGTAPGEPRCPEAGGWFDYQIKMLAKNAEL